VKALDVVRKAVLAHEQEQRQTIFRDTYGKVA
jgi:hypothetical protein